MVAEWATPELGSTAPADLESWEGQSERGGLLCIGAHDSARRRTLRDVIAASAAAQATRQSAVRRLITGIDEPLVINPYTVTPHARWANALMAVAPRNVLGARAETLRRSRIYAWLVDDRSSLAIDAVAATRRIVAAGVPAETFDPEQHTAGGRRYDLEELRELNAEVWGLPIDRPWVVHLCTIERRRDALMVAATLRRELRHADTGTGPVLVVVGARTDEATLKHLVSRYDGAGDVRLLGDVGDPTWLIAAADAVVLIGEGSRDDPGAATARSHPVFGSTKVAPRFRQRTVILGSGEKARELASVLADHRSANDVIGFLARDGDHLPAPHLGGPVLGTFNDLFHVVEKEQIQSIVVAVDDHDCGLPTESLFDLKTTGVQVVEGIHLLEQVSGRIHIEEISPYRVIFSDGFRRPRSVVALKRASDAIVAAVGLVALAPVFAVLAIMIRLDSPGPVFYRQLRIGLNGRPFSIWKFRSMRTDAERLHAPVWASKSDPRITRSGRWMRKWRLDELPQLLNVVRGDMSLVGPRPERPTFVQELRADIPYYDLRHTVRPGITGWAQVRFPYAASKAESYQKLQYDLYYVKHMSLRLDLRIAAETLRVMTRGEGAR